MNKVNELVNKIKNNELEKERKERLKQKEDKE